MEIKQLCLSDINTHMLDKFNRYQEVKKCWKRNGDKYELYDNSYIRKWEESNKQSAIDSFAWCINHGGYVVAAFIEQNIIGFANIDAELFGSNKQYALMGVMHVSFEYRNRGIGKRLFFVICELAKTLYAKKVYISAGSSEDTMAFYWQMGCVDAIEINQTLAKNEPHTIHLEFNLGV